MNTREPRMAAAPVMSRHTSALAPSSVAEVLQDAGIEHSTLEVVGLEQSDDPTLSCA